LHFRARIVRQTELEVAQHGILGVPAHADNIGKAEFGAVGIVNALKCLVFGIRQAIKTDAVLLGTGFRGQASGALCLVGEIGMRLD